MAQFLGRAGLVLRRARVVILPVAMAGEVAFDQHEREAVPSLARLRVERGLHLALDRLQDRADPLGGVLVRAEHVNRGRDDVVADLAPQLVIKGGRIKAAAISLGADSRRVKTADHHAVDWLGWIGDRKSTYRHPPLGL